MTTTTCTAVIENGTFKITGAKTIETYERLKYHTDAPMEGCFFAYNQKQYEEGQEKIKHLLPEGEKIMRVSSIGLFGVEKYIERFFDFYKEKNKLIKEQCDPQEVYYFEFNNHEICYTNDDEEAIKVILNIWGEKVAKTISRRCAAQTIDQILMYDLKRKIKLYYFDDGKPKVPSSVWLNEQGLAYTMVNCRLYPVYQSCGKQYKMSKKFADMTAYYDGKKLYKFHKE